ncbi:uncharacterized protein Hap1MRO34_018421 isoform 2-T3 [Clarias gariepinus]
MTNFSCICTVWISAWVDLLSAEPEISVSGPVGSTAVLPCQLTSVDTDTQYIRWNQSEIVFERVDKARYEGEGYEGRVDVPVEELRKGNCSLVLHNLTFTDTGFYTSSLSKRRINGSPDVKVVLINHVKLSVHNRTDEGSDINPGSGLDSRLCVHGVCMFFTCLVGFLWIPRFPPTVHRYRR